MQNTSQEGLRSAASFKSSSIIKKILEKKINQFRSFQLSKISEKIIFIINFDHFNYQ